MYVRDYMSTNVVTIPAEALVIEALIIMRENKVHRLPVIDHGRLVGIITQTRLRDVAPGPANSRSMWQMDQLLTTMKVKDVMEREVVTVTPDSTVEDAVMVAQKHGVGALPVVEDGQLVGIVTATDALRLYLGVLGVEEPGVRLHVGSTGKSVPLGEITSVIDKHGVEIHSFFTASPPGRQTWDLVMHLGTPDATVICEELRALGYTAEFTR